MHLERLQQSSAWCLYRHARQAPSLHTPLHGPW